jgi:SAM-dependent methyltransferase
MSGRAGLARRIGLLAGGARALARAVRVQRMGARRWAELSAGLSPELRAFVEEFPEERLSLLAFVRSLAASLPAGTRLLDAAAAGAPYRELFAHCRYVTADWAHSPHPAAGTSDVLGSLEALAIADAAFDAVLCTQALEHLADPLAALCELRRVTRPGGRLFLSAPLAWELHEEPHDYYRYTAHGLRHLLTAAGYEVESIVPRNGAFTTLAALMRTTRAALWSPTGPKAHEPPESERILAHRLLSLLTVLLPAFDDLDPYRRLPLGYSCVAVRPVA